MAVPHIVVLGGGFAGLSAARALGPMARRGQCRATLVDANPVTAMIPALPDYVAGLLPEDWVSAPIRSLLPPSVTFRQARVTEARTNPRLIETSAGSLSYDGLVLALGSVAAPPSGPDIAGRAFPLATWSDAQRLREAFERRLPERPPIVISGGGYTGVELAIAFARRIRREQLALPILLLDRNREILPFLTRHQRNKVRASLQRHGIALRTELRLSELTDDRAVLSDGEVVARPFVCRTEGTCAPLALADAPGDSLADGRVKTDPALALADAPFVFAAGDAAAIAATDGFARKAVNVSFSSGYRAGANMARQLRGAAPRPFRYRDLGWVIPLGDDSVGRAFGVLPMNGKAGLRLHYVMCGYRNYSMRNFLRFAGQALRAGRTL